MDKSFHLWVLILLVSCQATPAVDPATVRLAMSSEPDTLNPFTSTDGYSNQILNLVADSLVERDPDTFEFKPRLATHWEISPDHLSYTFHLRKGVLWHDGRPFTADDVVYSFHQVMDPKIEAPHLRSYFAGAGINHIEKLDDWTVRFRSDKPYFLAFEVCGQTLPIAPKHVFGDGTDVNQHPAGRSPIGLGPYRFVSWKTNKKIVLQRNEDFWGEKPAIKRVEFVIVSDPAIELQVLKKGLIHESALTPIQWVKQTGSPKFSALFNKYKYLLPGYSYIGWNLEDPIFSDKRVRTAMTLMVDREKLLAKLRFGLGKIVESPFFIESPQYHEGLKNHPHDLKRAVELLKEAGWADTDQDGLLDRGGKSFQFNFLYPAGAAFTERLATILKEDLKKIGIEMDIDRMEWAAFLGRIKKKDFQATALGWGSPFESDPYQVWHSSQAGESGGSNFVSFKNKEADSLMEKARMEFDPARRNALYDRFQEILYEEQPYTFLFSSYSLIVVSKKFGNVIVHKAGMDIKEWTVPDA